MRMRWLVLALAAEFFAAHGLDWVASEVLDSHVAGSLQMQQVARAVRRCFLVCPLLGALYTARQITGRMPEWGWDCMDLSTSAVLIQMLCHICMGLSSLEATFLVYLITSARYVAAFSLSIGLAGVFASFASSNTDGPAWLKIQRRVDSPVLILVASLCLAVLRATAEALKHSLESVELSRLGLRLHIKSSAVHLSRGAVNLGGLVVENPLGHDWISDCLVRVDGLNVDLNVQLLAESLGDIVEVEALELSGVVVNLEKHLGATSNVQTVREHLKQHRALGKHSAALADPPQRSAAQNYHHPTALHQGQPDHCDYWGRAVPSRACRCSL